MRTLLQFAVVIFPPTLLTCLNVARGLHLFCCCFSEFVERHQPNDCGNSWASRDFTTYIKSFKFHRTSWNLLSLPDHLKTKKRATVSMTAFSFYSFTHFDGRHSDLFPVCGFTFSSLVAIHLAAQQQWPERMRIIIHHGTGCKEPIKHYVTVSYCSTWIINAWGGIGKGWETKPNFSLYDQPITVRHDAGFTAFQY